MANSYPDASNPNSNQTPGESHRIEVRNADPLQAGLAGGLNWVEENAKLVAALVVIAILGGIGYIGLQLVGKRQERQAQEAYFAAEAKYAKIKEGFERAKFKAFLPPEQQASQPDAQAASGDLSKDYGTVVADLEKVAKDYAGTTASAQAALLAADTYLQYKQADKALELAQIPAQKLSKDHTLHHLGSVMWGNALAAKEDCQGAISQWQQVLEQPKATYLHADVSLRAGLCLEKMGQNDRAAEMYRKASSVAPESGAAQTAKGLLRALEMKSPAAAPAQNG